MKKINMLYVLGLAMMMPMVAEAQTVATVANTILGQIKSIPQTIGAISYVCGVFFGVMSAIKLKEHNESKGQVKLTAPIIYIIVSVLLLALPTFMNVGMETFGYDKASEATTKYGGY